MKRDRDRERQRGGWLEGRRERERERERACRGRLADRFSRSSRVETMLRGPYYSSVYPPLSIRMRRIYSPLPESLPLRSASLSVFGYVPVCTRRATCAISIPETCVHIHIHTRVRRKSNESKDYWGQTGEKFGILIRPSGG